MGKSLCETLKTGLAQYCSSHHQNGGHLSAECWMGNSTLLMLTALLDWLTDPWYGDFILPTLKLLIFDPSFDVAPQGEFDKCFLSIAPKFVCLGLTVLGPLAAIELATSGPSTRSRPDSGAPIFCLPRTAS
jgi:hypothetical protein